MTGDADHNLCPYCLTRQVGIADNNELYRCEACNYHICRMWLVTGPGEFELDNTRDVCCPWCAYPVALEQAVPGDGEFMCDGCAGTLIAEMLVTQASVAAERKQSMTNRGYFILIVLALVSTIIIMSCPKKILAFRFIKDIVKIPN